MNETSMELVAEREIVITRTFRARPKIVFEAWTNPDLVKRWWAPKSRCVEIVGCEADVRPGGKYRYELKNPEGHAFAFSGTYSEVTPPSRVIYTQVFEPMADAGEAIITVTFEDAGGHTRLVARELYPSAQVRAAVIESGMEHGMRETMNQLDDLVASMS